MRPLGREPQLLVLDEVRAGRLPHLFDDTKATVREALASVRQGERVRTMA